MSVTNRTPCEVILESGSSLGQIQKLESKSGVLVRVWAQSLKFGSEFGGQSLESRSEFGARVWRLGQSLRSGFGVWVRVLGRVWGQSLESGSEFGSKFEVRV